MMQTIFAWAKGQIASSGALSGYEAAPYTVIWGVQDGPYPGHPYATLQVVQPPATDGGKPERTVFDNHMGGSTTRAEYDANMFVRLELFSRAPLDPNSGLDETIVLINALEASLRTSQQLEAFAKAGLAFVENRPPLSVPMVAGFGFERRSQLDINFRVRVRVNTKSPIIDIPGVSGTVDFDGTVT